MLRFRNNPLLALSLILIIGLFFRTYQVVERFEFGHDADLYSWIVKDIAVNHHPRLIGQLTSAPGIFIGPLFYYLITPFILLTNMDPIGVLIPAIILGLLTILSYYLVLSKIFNIEVGLIGAFLYAILIATVNSDRWVVPTITTSLWSIWYFYSLILLSRGNFSVLFLLGILIGLIWHIHIALIPSLIAIPFAILFSKKLPNFKQIITFVITFSITSFPLILFEAKHNFGQTLSLINNFSADRIGPSGFYRFEVVLKMITKNINTLFFAPQSLNFTNNIFFILVLVFSSIILIKKKLLLLKELIPLYAWFAGVIIFFSLSSSPLSEYYFTNTNVVFLSALSLAFFLLKRFRQGKFIVFTILVFVLVKNLYFLIMQDYYNKGYLEKKAVVDFIMTDAKNKNFPCFSINYITYFGENTGFRYLFYLKDAHIAVAGRGSPVYSIVIPEEYAKDEVEMKFGHIGVIPPSEIIPQKLVKEACSGANTNLTDPLFGYVE